MEIMDLIDELRNYNAELDTRIISDLIDSKFDISYLRNYLRSKQLPDSEIDNIVRTILYPRPVFNLSNPIDYLSYSNNMINTLRTKLLYIISKYYNSEIPDQTQMIINSRYLLKYSDGQSDTGFEDIITRVARTITSVEAKYLYNLYSDDEYKLDVIAYLHNFELLLFQLLKARLIMPNSPVLFNIGVNNPKSIFEKDINDVTIDDYISIYNNLDRRFCLSACSVLSLGDSMEDINKTDSEIALLSKATVGVGVNISVLRPNGAIVRSNGALSSGSVSFGKKFNQTLEVVKQSRRRGAGMMVGGMYVGTDFLQHEIAFHPDISEFIHSKEFNKGDNVLNNFNISVGINNSNSFVNAIENNEKIPLIFDGVEYDKVDANEIFNEIAALAWKTGDPGLLLFDKINKNNPIVDEIPYLSTNPCFGYNEEILTDEGYIKIGELDGQIVNVWAPLLNTYVPAKIFKTGEKPTITLTFNNKLKMVITPDHKLMDADTFEWIESKDALGHKILHYSYYDIKSNSEYSKFYIDMGLNISDNTNVLDIIDVSTYNNIVSFLRGYFSNNARIESNKIVITSNNSKNLYNINKILYTYCGIVSDVVLDENNKESLLILDPQNIFKFASEIGFADNKNDILKKLIIDISPKVINITTSEILPVYDFTMNTSHVGVVNDLVCHNCGEQPLAATYTEEIEKKYGRLTGMCNLMSIDVSKIANDSLDILFDLAYIAAWYLDDIIDLNMFPIVSASRAALLTRNIGVGITGVAGYFILNGVRYGSDKSLEIAENLIYTLEYGSTKFSTDMAKYKGVFPLYKLSQYATKYGFNPFLANDEKGYITELNKYPRRNIATTSLAPEGTRSRVMEVPELGDTGTGIEPLYALKYKRYITLPNENKRVETNYVVKLLENELVNDITDMDINKVLLDLDLYGIQYIIDKYDLDSEKYSIFCTSMDLSPIEHLRVQESFQKYNSSSTSKTINMPNSSTIDAVKDVFLYALKSPYIKGVTIYRDGSLESQVLKTDTKESNKIAVFNLDNNDLISNNDITADKLNVPIPRPNIIYSLKETVTFIDNEYKNQILNIIENVYDLADNGYELPEIISIITNDLKLTEEKKMHIELGFTKDRLPFEVFIRTTESSKEYTTISNAIGRLISIALRSRVDFNSIIAQLRKVKTFYNQYFQPTIMIADVLSELYSIAQIESESNRNIVIDDINKQTKNWKYNAGVYIDENGKMRCPSCKSVIERPINGCIECKVCGWAKCE